MPPVAAWRPRTIILGGRPARRLMLFQPAADKRRGVSSKTPGSLHPRRTPELMPCEVDDRRRVVSQKPQDKRRIWHSPGLHHCQRGPDEVDAICRQPPADNRAQGVRQRNMPAHINIVAGKIRLKTQRRVGPPVARLRHMFSCRAGGHVDSAAKGNFGRVPDNIQPEAKILANSPALWKSERSKPGPSIHHAGRVQQRRLQQPIQYIPHIGIQILPTGDGPVPLRHEVVFFEKRNVLAFRDTIRKIKIKAAGECGQCPQQMMLMPYVIGIEQRDPFNVTAQCVESSVTGFAWPLVDLVYGGNPVAIFSIELSDLIFHRPRRPVVYNNDVRPGHALLPQSGFQDACQNARLALIIGNDDGDPLRCVRNELISAQ